MTPGPGLQLFNTKLIFWFHFPQTSQSILYLKKYMFYLKGRMTEWWKAGGGKRLSIHWLTLPTGTTALSKPVQSQKPGIHPDLQCGCRHKNLAQLATLPGALAGSWDGKHNNHHIDSGWWCHSSGSTPWARKRIHSSHVFKNMSFRTYPSQTLRAVDLKYEQPSGSLRNRSWFLFTPGSVHLGWTIG